MTGTTFLRLAHDGDKAVVAFCGGPLPRDLFFNDRTKKYESWDDSATAGRKKTSRFAMNVFVVTINGVETNAMKVFDMTFGTMKRVLALRDQHGLGKCLVSIARRGGKGETKTKYAVHPDKDITPRQRAACGRPDPNDPDGWIEGTTPLINLGRLIANIDTRRKGARPPAPEQTDDPGPESTQPTVTSTVTSTVATPPEPETGGANGAIEPEANAAGTQATSGVDDSRARTSTGSEKISFEEFRKLVALTKTSADAASPPQSGDPAARANDASAGGSIGAAVQGPQPWKGVNVDELLDDPLIKAELARAEEAERRDRIAAGQFAPDDPPRIEASERATSARPGAPIVPAPADAPAIEHAVALGRCGLLVIFNHTPLFGDSRIPSEEHPTATSCTCRLGTECPPKHRGKHPIAARWQTNATDDELRLRDQYMRLRVVQPNVGIVLGEQPGGQYVVAVDVDDDARYRELVAELGPLPETVRIDSARGPKLLYAVPADTPVERLKNIAGLGGKPGVDVKVKGGQIVAPPSRHPSGVLYAWGRMGSVAELPAAWLLAILAPPERPKTKKSAYTPGLMPGGAREQKRARAYLDAAVRAEAAILARTAEGGRNTGLYTSLCRLLPLAHGPEMPLDAHDHVVRELSSAAAAAGLGDREIATTVASAERKVGGQAREMPPPTERPRSRAHANGAPPREADASESTPPSGADSPPHDRANGAASADEEKRWRAGDDPLARLASITDVESAGDCLDDTAWLLAILDAGEGARARATEALAEYVGRRAVERAYKRARQQRLQAEGQSHTGDGSAESHGRYFVSEGRLFVVSDDGPPRPICNFTGRILENITIDDGAACKHKIVLAGVTADGVILPAITVDATPFGSSHAAWVVEGWGAVAIVEADCQQHIRPAIQHHSGGFMMTRAYAHTGWREIEVQDGDKTVRKLVYLSAGGVIGASGVTVRLEDGLQRYALPLETAHELDVIEAVHESLRMVDVAPDRVSIPLVATPYRAVLNHWRPFDSIVWLHGPTGSLKSSLAALVLGYFGTAWDRTKMTATFLDTPASIETKLFRAKDAVAVLDDYAPDNSNARDAVLGLAQQVARSVGNGQSRGRMRSNMDEMPSRPPRALVVVTAEDQMVGGESIAARTLPVGIRREEVNMEVMTHLQQHRQQLPIAMRAYIEWLARFDGVGVVLDKRFVEFRQTYQGAHLRAPEAAANLELGWHVFLAFALDVGAIDEELAEQLRERGRKALTECLEAQAITMATEEPVRMFLDALRELVHTGQVSFASEDAHIETRYTTVPHGENESVVVESRTEQKQIGWLCDDWVAGIKYVHLLPDVTFAEVTRALKRSGRSLRITARELWRRLQAQGYVTPYESRRLTVRRTHAGKDRYVVELRVDAITGSDPANTRSSK